MKKITIAALLAMLVAGIASAAEDLQFLRPLRTQSATATTTAARPFSAFATGVNVIRVVAAQDTFISLGISNPAGAGTNNAPIATKTTGFLVPASGVAWLRVSSGEMLSIIASTTAGGFFVTEMGK